MGGTDHISQVEPRAAASGLCVLGQAQIPVAAAQGATDPAPASWMILLGTAPTFWPMFKKSPEFRDGGTDPGTNPMDRWSRRIIGAMARDLGATAHFPFTGPPYAPFVGWALASGSFFTSPSQMLVHKQQGMLISLRGALEFTLDAASVSENRDGAPPAAPATFANMGQSTSPCQTCESQACVSTCPVGALPRGGPYDTLACHGFLDRPEGQECLQTGCLARRACPLSAGAMRDPEQTAHHMRAFHAPHAKRTPFRDPPPYDPPSQDHATRDLTTQDLPIEDICQ